MSLSCYSLPVKTGQRDRGGRAQQEDAQEQAHYCNPLRISHCQVLFCVYWSVGVSNDDRANDMDQTIIQ